MRISIVFLNTFWSLCAVTLSALNVDFSDVSLLVPPAQDYTEPGGGGVYYNGSDAVGGFISNGTFFGNTFTDWGGGSTSWEGWAYSTTTDTVTPGFGNQYSAFAGSGMGDSVYGVGYVGFSGNPVIVLPDGYGSPLSLGVTNISYTAIALRDGDAFSKQFGGISGDDPDWFMLTLMGKDQTGATTGILDFYLADFRFTDNEQDYILDQWDQIDLTPLGTDVRSIEFSLSSSDVGSFGMNTPAYFAIDNLEVIPEPATYALMLGSLAILLTFHRRRTKS